MLQVTIEKAWKLMKRSSRVFLAHKHERMNEKEERWHGGSRVPAPGENLSHYRNYNHRVWEHEKPNIQWKKWVPASGNLWGFHIELESVFLIKRIPHGSRKSSGINSSGSHATADERCTLIGHQLLINGQKQRHWQNRSWFILMRLLWNLISLPQELSQCSYKWIKV